MRHYGTDCRNTPTAKHRMCNEGYVDNEIGNSCAEITHRSHFLSFSTGSALDISRVAVKSPIHLHASLSPSLQTWKAGAPGTCSDVGSPRIKDHRRFRSRLLLTAFHILPYPLDVLDILSANLQCSQKGHEGCHL